MSPASNPPSTTRSIVGVLELLALLDVAPLEARRLLTARVGDAALRSNVAAGVGMNGSSHSGTRIAERMSTCLSWSASTG